MTSQPTGPPLVSMRNIHVRYNDVPALNGVDFDLYPGEIHAVIGEHRAGKSTLVKLLSGSAQKNHGTIHFQGKSVEGFSSASSLQSGIGMVYQETTVIPAVNAVENVYSGQMPRNRFGRIRRRYMEQEVEKALEWLGVSIDLHVSLYRLTPAEQHIVEFLRAIINKPTVIILDELANKLTPKEMKLIYRTLFIARNNGTGIIYISHDLDEVLKLADRVTILRSGYRRGTEQTVNLDKYRLFQLTYSFSLDRERLEYSRMKFLLMKQYFQNIINFLPMGTVILDPENTVQLTNVKIVDTLGINPDRAIGASAAELLSPFADTTRSQIQHALFRHRHIALREIELSEGQSINVQVIPLTDEDSAFLGSAILFEDVSLNRSMQDYLIESEKMASVAEVAVGVAHEINNPLFTIKNYLQVMLDSAIEDEMRDKLEKVDREAGRIMETVSSLLSFSRVQRQPEPKADLKTVVEEVLTLVKHKTKQKAITVRTEFTVAQAPVHCEENKLKQLVMNLLMNSTEAVLQNGTIEVLVGSGGTEGYYDLRIRDDGYGVPEDIADSIFEPFFSTKVTKKNTGLGLSICRNIVEDFGGAIDFESKPGHFTEFLVQLPTAEE